jgi:hypothetical protein
MNNLKLTVEQAMDALNVPQAQRDMYAGLIGRKQNTVKISGETQPKIIRSNLRGVDSYSKRH